MGHYQGNMGWISTLLVHFRLAFCSTPAHCVQFNSRMAHRFYLKCQGRLQSSRCLRLDSWGKWHDPTAVFLRCGGHEGGELAAVSSILWSKILSEYGCQEETQATALHSGWLSCMKIPCKKMVCNAWVLLSMLLGKSLLEKFSVWANVNCPCSSILTVLAKSKKSLFFVYILGEFGKIRFFASHHWTHETTQSWLSQNRIIIRFPEDSAAYLKMQRASISRSVAQKEVYLCKKVKYLQDYLFACPSVSVI